MGTVKICIEDLIGLAEMSGRIAATQEYIKLDSFPKAEVIAAMLGEEVDTGAGKQNGD